MYHASCFVFVSNNTLQHNDGDVLSLFTKEGNNRLFTALCSAIIQILICIIFIMVITKTTVSLLTITIYKGATKLHQWIFS